MPSSVGSRPAKPMVQTLQVRRRLAQKLEPSALLKANGAPRAPVPRIDLNHSIFSFLSVRFQSRHHSFAFRPSRRHVSPAPRPPSIHRPPSPRISLDGCRRKKKCIRWADSADHNNDDGDNLGSVGSVEAPTPDSKSANESDPDHPNYSPGEMSLSSPPVPSQHSGDYIIPHHLHLSNGMRTSSQISHSSSAAAMVLACPPRNSPIGPNNPLSVEQLIRPHCPPR